jgi:AraC-like DNA-binding protein
LKYSIIKPYYPLSEYVRYYWILEGIASSENPYLHRTLANASPELLFHYRGSFEELCTTGQYEKSFSSGIHAQTNLHRKFSIQSDFGIFGVYLQPYSIPALFNMPSTEVVNEMPDLVSLLGQVGKDLTEKMMLAKGNKQRLSIINQFLIERIAEFDRPEIIHATQKIIRTNGLYDVKELASQAYLSQRQFERKFKEYIGFSPKLFSRIVRFNALLPNYKNEDVTLTELAFDFGYYDQSHFIHDFIQFSGYNPNTYFKRKADDAFYSP